MAVKHQAKTVEFLRIAQVSRGNNLVEPGLKDAVCVLSRSPILIVALHIGMRRLAIRHAVLRAIRLDHVSVIAGAAVAGVFHALAIFAVRLVLAGGGLLATILILLISGVIRLIAIILGIILIRG